MPIPGASDNIIDGRILRLPLKIAANSFGAGYQRGRVAVAPRGFLFWDRLAGDLASGCNHFPNTEAIATA